MKIKGTFVLSEYSTSLKVLRMKASSFENTEVEEIVFVGVTYLQIPSTIYNPVINIGHEDDLKYIDSQLIGTTTYWQFENVFIIEDEDKNKYYIVAAICDVNYANSTKVTIKEEK